MTLDKNRLQAYALDGTIIHHNLVADEGAYVTVQGRDSQPMTVVFDMKDLKAIAEMYRQLELRSVLDCPSVVRWADRPMTDEELTASHRLISRALNGIRSNCLDWACTASNPWAEAGRRQLASDCLQQVEHQLMQVYPEANDREMSGD
ncbi:hypothetical protein RQN9TF_17960 [Rhodococcus qingshengii]|uniref:hypothetical protein n=1 Tax=Rhodococcus TaxID=1827 RepID=UPI000F61CF0A|nr:MULTISPECIES: hypothetical protein [Rhodococcus]AZI62762.1 hypothetical protein EHW12_17515 [Rhodococcus sp. NJ-530]BDQ21102.1 hypothetical protein RQN9TF_17960 [Rhodococcus qingshengii]